MMPLESFSVATYRVRTEHRNQGGSHIFDRIIDIDGVPLAHGIVPKAVLSFRTAWNVWNNDRVGYLALPPPNTFQGTTLAGWFGDRDFELYYKILQEEKPVSVFYDREAAQTANGYYCTMVGLGSSMEPIGEGPKDV
jgi:hypothetical protein